MIFNSFITQIVMAVLAGGILLLYVKPAFSEIGLLQNAVIEYKTELEKINSTNDKLASLSAKVASVSASDFKSLLTYMPDSVDDVAVARDIFIMSELSGTYLEDVTYDSTFKKNSKNTEEADVNAPIPHAFSVRVSGTYEQVKDFLSKLEQNDYPLEVRSLKMSSSISGLISSDMTIVTYSHI